MLWSNQEVKDHHYGVVAELTHLFSESRSAINDTQVSEFISCKILAETRQFKGGSSLRESVKKPLALIAQQQGKEILVIGGSTSGIVVSMDINYNDLKQKNKDKDDIIHQLKLQLAESNKTIKQLRVKNKEQEKMSQDHEKEKDELRRENNDLRRKNDDLKREDQGLVRRDAEQVQEIIRYKPALAKFGEQNLLLTKRHEKEKPQPSLSSQQAFFGGSRFSSSNYSLEVEQDNEFGELHTVNLT